MTSLTPSQREEVRQIVREMTTPPVMTGAEMDAVVEDYLTRPVSAELAERLSQLREERGGPDHG